MGQGNGRPLSLRAIDLGRATIDSMIKPPTAHIYVALPPADVIGFIADPTNGSRWMEALEVAELITPGPIGPGSRFREVQSADGQRIETICEIVEFDPERRYAWRSVGDGEAQYGGGFTATPATGGGTELRYDLAGPRRPAGWPSARQRGRVKRSAKRRRSSRRSSGRSRRWWGRSPDPESNDVNQASTPVFELSPAPRAV
jgi:hypothetical protein